MKIVTIIKKPNQQCEVTKIDNSLKSLQECVGGLIEAPYIPGLSEKGITMFVNEEGKLLDLDMSIVLQHNGEVTDVIFGNALFTSSDENGETTSLSEEQIQTVLSHLNSNVKFVTLNSEILDIIRIK